MLEEQLAQKIADSGKEMNVKMFLPLDNLFRIFSNDDYFAVAIANAFTWASYAVNNKDNYFKFAINYLTTGNTASLMEVGVFSGQFGPEKLISGLQGWKFIIDQLGKQNFQSCSAGELYNIQNECLLIANQKQPLGIGPWLFCAPFKIVAIQRNDLWGSEDLDDVLMPLGTKVIRGVKKLIQQGCTYTQSLDINMFSEEEGGLKEGIGTAKLVQDISKKIAKISKTRVLHINSGLYLYGKEET